MYVCYRALQEAQEIFGIDFDFEEFEQYDEDEEEDDVDDDVKRFIQFITQLASYITQLASCIM